MTEPHLQNGSNEQTSQKTEASSLLGHSGLADLTYGKAEFSLVAEENAVLPPFLGSTLRGSLGHSLRKISCLPLCRDPATCILRERCAYAYCFETHLPRGSQVLRGLEHIPHPLVIEPPLARTTAWKEGDQLRFNLLLVGKAVGLFAYFVAAIDRMAKGGLGKGRSRFRLLEAREATAENPQKADQPCKETVLWSTSKERIDPLAQRQFDLSWRKAPNSVTLRFLTPARILSDGCLQSKLTFRQLTRALLARLSSLLYFHCSSQLKLDFRSILDMADKVEVVERQIQFEEFKRWSSRQERKIRLDCVVGQIRFAGGDLSEFIPLIEAGEVLHVGKGTVFGLGRYRISSGEEGAHHERFGRF